MYIRLTKRNKIIVALASICLVVPTFVFLLFEYNKELKERLVYKVPGTPIKIPLGRVFNLGLAILVIVALMPYTLVITINANYESKMERDLPLFFRELAESVRSGVPLIKAIEEISLRSSGPLREEMRKVVFRTALGVTLEDSLKMLTTKVDTYSTKVMSVILNEAYASGARVIDVLETAGDVYSMLLSFELERRAKITPYAWTIYISLILFLVTSTVITEIFFKPLSTLAAGVPFLKSTLMSDIYEVIFYYVSLLESVFGGLIVGKMKAGKISRGLLHSIILVSITALFYGLIVPVVTRFILFPTIRR